MDLGDSDTITDAQIDASAYQGWPTGTQLTYVLAVTSRATQHVPLSARSLPARARLRTSRAPRSCQCSSRTLWHAAAAAYALIAARGHAAAAAHALIARAARARGCWQFRGLWRGKLTAHVRSHLGPSEGGHCLCGPASATGGGVVGAGAARPPRPRRARGRGRAQANLQARHPTQQPPPRVSAPGPDCPRRSRDTKQLPPGAGGGLVFASQRRPAAQRGSREHTGTVRSSRKGGNTTVACPQRAPRRLRRSPRD